MATKMTYREQLLHPNWQRKRLERLNAAGWTCSSCGAKEDTLHVHHRRYVKGKLAWEYEDRELDVLCDGCHKVAHTATDVLEWVLTHGDAISTPKLALALLSGWLAYQDKVHPDTADSTREIAPAVFDMGVVAMALMYYSPAAIASFLESDARTVKDPMPEALVSVIERFKAMGI